MSLLIEPGVVSSSIRGSRAVLHRKQHPVSIVPVKISLPGMHAETRYVVEQLNFVVIPFKTLEEAKNFANLCNLDVVSPQELRQLRERMMCEEYGKVSEAEMWDEVSHLLDDCRFAHLDPLGRKWWDGFLRSANPSIIVGLLNDLRRLVPLWQKTSNKSPSILSAWSQNLLWKGSDDPRGNVSFLRYRLNRAAKLEASGETIVSKRRSRFEDEELNASSN
jgi:hypothetical protein